jgi:hypothetical protein
MTSEVKIYGINMFINKFDTTGEIIDMHILKTTFLLDEGETGFYKLSISQKKILGTETVNDTYNRPPIGPIEDKLYCQYCGRVGPQDHDETCEFPDKDSLYLTIGAFKTYILLNGDYKGDYSEIKDKILSKTLTQEDLNEILLIPDEIIVTSGQFDIDSNDSTLTNISFFGIYKKRGPRKLASKTSITQFLNNLMISYENYGRKTSVRISKNGLINLINVPENEAHLREMIDTLIHRINNSGAVNIDEFQRITGTDLSEYQLIENKSYIHSTSGQFNIREVTSGTQINFQELNDLISPYDSSGNIISGYYTTIETTGTGHEMINFRGVKIIEWEYSLGRMTRNQVMSKEYIKFTSIPAPGVKLTGIVNKGGSIMMVLSFCTSTQLRKGFCGTTTSTIKPYMFDMVVNNFDNLFRDESSLLLKKTLLTPDKTKTTFNTVSGYAPKGSICRRTRSRDYGKEGMRPEPYSWKGRCPDPNYQYMNPEGVLWEDDGRWYPCCETKTKDSVEMMKKYLLTGFPRNKAQGENFNIIDGLDLGSGIIIPGSNVIGATASVNINGKFEEVTIMKKLGKKLNQYSVRTSDGKMVTIDGFNFLRDSRVFPGLSSFSREQLLNCIFKNLKKTNSFLNESGDIIKNETTELNEKLNNENSSIFTRLIDVSKLNFSNLTYFNISKFKEHVYTVRKVPGDCHKFYLILSPTDNFYINDELNSLESQISNKFEDTTIVLDGFLKFNDVEFKNEYHIIDILYYNENLQDKTFEERYRILFDLQSLTFGDIVDEIFVYPDIYTNIIEGSYDIISINRGDKLVFIKNDCCDLIIWGNKDIYPDIIPLQIIKKDKQVIEFGCSGNSLPDDIGLDFLKDYTFNKREIPEKLFIGDYFNVKINRDSNGNIVPNRKLTILNKTTDNFDYFKTIEILLVKFNPIDYTFFNSREEWVTLDESLVSDGEKLIET